MPLIDDKVRAAFPGLSDAQILEFYEVAKAAQTQKIEITQTDLGLAMIAQELGWSALKEYLYLATGDKSISAMDIVSISQAAAFRTKLRTNELYSALYGSSSEVTSRKTVNARKKGLKDLTGSIDLFEVIEGL